MKALIVLAVAPALLFAGCTRIERETVVEKPVVQKETVVEKRVPEKEVVVERQVVSPRSCAYNSTAYSHGSLSCQSNLEFRCDDGIWRGLSTSS
jgi:hypothetical protein